MSRSPYPYNSSCPRSGLPHPEPQTTNHKPQTANHKPRPSSYSALFISLLTVIVAVLTLGGCQQFFSVIFDIPPRQQTSTSSQQVAAQSQQNPAQIDTERPPIEEILIADSVKTMLPRDHAGNIDWMEAKRNGTIKPRDSIHNSGLAAGEDSFLFGFDFFFEGPAPTFDAYFPHSAHTEWVNCQQCHGRIFRYRDTPIQMADVLAGKYCGECHGKVAFPPITGCERCHVDLPQNPDRAQPDLLGTIRMTRSERSDSLIQTAATDSSTVVAAAEEVLITDESLPPAVFPHWVHRIRFTCKACHMELFEPVAGANSITMEDISAGNACGACHDGTTAFNAGFGECQRCHTPLESTAP